MKKFVKLSLVAAVAVAGLSTTASAADVNVNGSLAHQIQKKSTSTAPTITNTKVSLKLSGKVSDTLKYVVSYSERIGSQTTAIANGTNGLKLSNAKFIQTFGSTTVIAGRQGVTTPWTSGSNTIDSTVVGNGVVAIAKVGPATLIGGYVMNHNVANAYMTKDSDITVLGAKVKAGAANLGAWYVDVAADKAATTKGLDGYTFTADGKVAMVGLKARYSSVTPGDSALLKKQSLFSVGANVKVSSVKITAAYAKSGNDGDLVSIDPAGDASNNQYLGTWNISMGGGKHNDSKLVTIGASMPLTSTLTGVVNYGKRSNTTTTDKELKLQISAKVAKNMSLYLRYADVKATASVDDFTRTRLYVAYKF